MTDISPIFSSAGVNAYRAAREVPATESFGDVLRQAAGDAVDTARSAEGIAAAGLRGEIDTQRVVEATLELETTLRVAVSMRDKFVQAYQDVLRMQI